MLKKIRNIAYVVLLLICSGVSQHTATDDIAIDMLLFGGIIGIWVIYIFLSFISKKGKEINSEYKNYNSNKRSKEEKIYSQIYSEIESNTFRKGLMAKALEQSHGDRKKAESLYVKFRFQSIKDENAK